MVQSSKHKAIDDTFSQRIDELLYSKTDEKKIASGFKQLGEKKLFEQCQYYMGLFKIDKSDLIKNSYGDCHGR